VKIGFIGDIVGKPAREIIAYHLKNIKKEHNLDFVIANGENASHGFGLSKKNADELLGYGIDLFTGGNHSFDKKEIMPFLDSMPILRPDNYPDGVKGNGIFKCEIDKEKLAVINILGEYSMPNVDNPFIHIQNLLQSVHKEGYKNIFIDFHAQATAEKRTLYMMIKDEVSAICGTHTHIGTDDMTIENGCFYVTDVGLSGCRDGVIGMEESAPIKNALTAIKHSFDIPKKCKTILQMIILELDNGKCIDAYKIKAYDKNEPIVSDRAFVED
jgi:metallophosphoesterase (TIGR00282 family)